MKYIFYRICLKKKKAYQFGVITKSYQNTDELSFKPWFFLNSLFQLIFISRVPH